MWLSGRMVGQNIFGPRFIISTKETSQGWRRVEEREEKGKEERGERSHLSHGEKPAPATAALKRLKEGR